MLAPTHCGVLQSFSPIAYCSSPSGYGWQFRAPGGTIWAANAVAVAQVVVLATALGAAAVVGLTLALAARSRSRRQTA